MKLWAISDLHIGREVNRKALQSLRRRPRDGSFLAGDIGETETELADAFEFLQRRFAKLIWVPGNHELWTTDNAPGSAQATRGEARYSALIALARSYGVVTPEDPYPLWPASDRPIVIAPLFTLFDYSFRPDDVSVTDVVDWAAAEGIVSADESLLDPAPYPDRAAWCAQRVERTAARLCSFAGRLGYRFSQPLSLTIPSCAAVNRASVRAVVRHATDRGLAVTLSRRCGGVWPPPHPAQLRTGQHHVSRSFVRLSGTMGSKGAD